MPTDGGDSTDRGRALDQAVREALDGLADLGNGGLDDIDPRWLALGIRLGLERPDRARAVLEQLANLDVGGSALDATITEEPPWDATAIPAASLLLARAAALKPADWESVGPEVVFGWVARLTASEVLRIGRVVSDMLAGGAPPDVARGFGLAWTDGVRIPRPELDVMLQEFTELEITVGGILAGGTLRTGEPAAPRQGLAAWFGAWIPQTRPGESQAAAAVERHGEPGKRGLVALWNVWIAMRYRTLIPPPTFELLVRPWVTAIGPLPAPA